ncbi:hypothetical protein FJZ17_03815 [Candidatus Pacearchaeota archaeon]|nr:hypothetical protein [Candidatus Pacearchaeota archaeon]
MNSQNLPELNVPATLVFNNINLNNPVVLRDGVLCNDCLVKYSPGIAVVEVPGFSTYELVESDIYLSSISSQSGLGNNQTPQESSCIPLWTCSNWTECIDNSQIRECFDQNICNSGSGKPNEVQTCSISSEIVCIPDWDCSDFTPEVCPESGERTRECLDKNNCNIKSNKPEEKEECLFEEKSYFLLVIVLVVVFLLAGILFYYFKYFRNKNTEENKSENKPFQQNLQNNQFRRPLPKRMPPIFYLKQT